MDFNITFKKNEKNGGHQESKIYASPHIFWG